MDSVWEKDTIYEFAGFRMIPSEELLLHNDRQIDLNPKAFAVLSLLVRRHGHLVSKSEIMETIWEGAFVEEGAVSKAVWFARNALGDSSKEKFIQTIPRRGYRFVAPVVVLNDPVNGSFRSEEISTGYRIPVIGQYDERDTRPDVEHRKAETNGGAKNVSSAEIVAVGLHPNGSAGELLPSGEMSDAPQKNFALLTPARPHRLMSWSSSANARLAAFIAGIVIVTVFFGYYGFTRKASSGSPRSIAVLPVAPIDPAERNVLYEVGIADSLINRLSSAEGVIVRSLSSVRSYADGPIDPLAVGREQNVEYVLVSNYQIADGKIKVTAQLYNVSNGKVENTFSKQDVANVFAAQDAVAVEFGNKLIAQFGASFRGPAKELGTSNEEAYRHYLLAMNFNELRGAENGRNALEHIEQAVARDPNFARAWAAKAYIHRYVASQGGDRHDEYRKSMAAVNNALAIDPNLSEAYSALCFNKNRYEYDAAGAEGACRRALDLDPESPLAHKLYSNFLYSQGRFEEAIAEIKRAMELQPVSYDNQQTYAVALYYARRYDEAEAEWKRLIDLNPNHGIIYTFLAECLKRQDKDSEAFEYVIKRLSIDKADNETMERFKSAFAASGWRGVTMERIKKAEAEVDPEPEGLARLYADLHDKDHAFEYLEKAYQRRSHMISVLKVDPRFDSLRDDARYADLVRRVDGK